MVRFINLWKGTPADIEAFDQHYREIHIPLAKKLTGLQRYTLSRNMTPLRGGEPYYQIGELDFDDKASLQHAFQSPEGKATSEDVNYIVAAFGVEVQSMIYELDDL